MVSMKDIASACGVSVATVSKALNDQKDVGVDTRTRIRETAKQMGYLPNAQARALKTNRTYNLGVLFVDEAQSGLTHDYFANVLDSLKKSAEERGYDITFINCCKNSANQMNYLERCLYRGFDGVVIACVNFQDPQVIELINSSIPVVTIDYVFHDTIAIVSDNVKGMEELFSYIYESGHRKIAYIHGNASSVTQNRLTTFYQTAEKYGVKIPDEYVKEAAYRDVSGAAEKTAELLELPDPPTCIIYPDDFSAFGGINVIRQRGLKIPEDVSIAGYDGIAIAEKAVPSLTTVKQNTRNLGAYAAEKLISLIEHPKTTIIQKIVVDGTLEKGSTIKQLV